MPNCTLWKRKLLVAKKVTLTMAHQILEMKFFKIFFTFFFPKVCWQFLLFSRKKQNWNCNCEFSHLKFFNHDVMWQQFDNSQKEHIYSKWQLSVWDNHAKIYCWNSIHQKNQDLKKYLYLPNQMSQLLGIFRKFVKVHDRNVKSQAFLC